MNELKRMGLWILNIMWVSSLAAGVAAIFDLFFAFFALQTFLPNLIPATLTPWLIAAWFVAGVVFILDFFVGRLVRGESAEPLEGISWLTFGTGGRSVIVIPVWIVLIFAANALSIPLSRILKLPIQIEAVTPLTSVAILGLILLIFRWVPWSPMKRLRHESVGVLFAFIGIYLVNSVGVFFAPHTLWPAVPFIVACFTLGLARIPKRIAQVGGSMVVLLGALGIFMRSEPNHFWLNNYAAGQYGAWQWVQVLTDFDADGFGSILGGKDCAPFDSNVHPAKMENVGNGVDETCGEKDLSSSNHYGELGKPDVSFKNPTRKPNVLFITIDTLRADAVNLEGDTLTPVLAEIARNGQGFANAYTPSPHTNEAMPASFSGMYPIDWHQKGTFFGIQPTLPALLRDVGYSTSAVICFPSMDQVVVSGFDYVDNSLALKFLADQNSTSGEETTDIALKRLDEVREDPFVLWVHYFDPHMPLVPGEYPPGTGLWAHYSQEVARTDRAVGRFLEGVADRGLLNDTVIVIYSDHGEGLGEHRIMTHGWASWESLLRVPLIFRLPGVPVGKHDARVSLVDIVPTLIEYLGLQNAGYRRGVSLLPTMFGMETPERALFFESNPRPRPFGFFRAVIRGDHKFVFDLRRSGYALFDLKSDPDETHNLIDKKPELAASLKAELDLWWKESHNDVAVKEKAAVWEDRKPSPPKYFVGDVGVVYEDGLGITKPVSNAQN